ncbi:hypothetical protein HUU05_21345 [candidate division KSB1 bacterium]|nr:hypothetical protein [candidate division KSB1 bacterium]
MAPRPLRVINHHNPMQPYRVDYQPQLLEEAVLLAMRSHEDEPLFRWERDQIYVRFETEEREAAFQQLHLSWFDILRMGEPLQECFETWPLLREATQRCLIMKARTPKEAGAELYAAAEGFTAGNDAAPTLLIQLTPGLLHQPAALLAFLRHELLHVVDMLDPHFDYTPDFPTSYAGPAYDHLLRGRYAVLWDVIVEGRMLQHGWVPLSAREKQFSSFKRAFQGSEEKLAESFAHFFDRNSHTHHELVEFAQHPEKWLGREKPESSSRGRCAICHFPTFRLASASMLAQEVQARIQQDYPAWNATQLVCQQCADLYESRVDMA